MSVATDCNTVASDLMLSDEQIVNLISVTHLLDEENFDAESLLVVVEKIFKRAKNVASNVFYDDEYMNVEEKVSRAGFNPMIEQISSEMACEAPSVEVIMSILNKLSNYSWDAKLVLILAAYALNYEDFWDIPDNVAPLRKEFLLPLLRFDDAIINCTLLTMKYFLEVKKVTKVKRAFLSDVGVDIPVGVYWIIVTCTTHMLKLRRNRHRDLDSLVNKIRSIFYDNLWWRITNEMCTRRKLKGLFARDAMQPLIDGSTKEQVSIDVLENKNIILIISGLNIYKEDLSNLMSIYNEIKEKGDQYKIVWIPIVELWTSNLRRKFEMLQSKMPWCIVQCFSAVADIKFIEERYDNEPVLVLMNPQGKVEDEHSLVWIRRKTHVFLCLLYKIDLRVAHMERSRGIRLEPMVTLALRESMTGGGGRRTAPGPYEIQEYTFLLGGKDKRWIEQFCKKVNVVAEDQLIREAGIIINCYRVPGDGKQEDFNEDIQKLLCSVMNNRRWAVLMHRTNFSEVISKDGTTILQVVEKFEEWKVNVRQRDFHICFKEYNDKLLPTGSQPSASRNFGLFIKAKNIALKCLKV